MARKARKGVELQSERGSEPARSGAPNPHMLAARQAKRGRYTTEGSTVGEVAAGGRAVRQGRASGICDAGEKVHTRTHAHTHTHKSHANRRKRGSGIHSAGAAAASGSRMGVD